jgi:hypothetical protein
VTGFAKNRSATVTEKELRKSGFAGGDAELKGKYQELIGAAPAFAPGLEPEWCRAVMFELVTAAAVVPPPRRRRRQAAAHAARL